MKYKFFSIIVVLFLISFVSADFQLGIPENKLIIPAIAPTSP